MKNIIVAILLLAFSTPLFSQRVYPHNYSRRDEYLAKSARKEKAGIILLSAGGAALAGGIIITIDGSNRYHRNGTTYNGNGELNAGEAEIVLGVLVSAVGVGAMCASIPFFVGAHRGRVKAMSLSFKTENMPILSRMAVSRQMYPALAFRLPLGR